MANNDLRLDIPLRAYLNGKLLAMIERGGTLFDAKKQLFALPEFAGRIDPYQYTVVDQSSVISVLFCTIVVPREFLDLPPNHKIYRDFDSEDVSSLFSVTEPAQINAYLLLRCLRNSVAHVLFSISESGGVFRYEFWTEKPPIFRARIGQNELIKFISIVGHRLTNAVQEQRRGGSEVTS